MCTCPGRSRPPSPSDMATGSPEGSGRGTRTRPLPYRRKRILSLAASAAGEVEHNLVSPREVTTMPAPSTLLPFQPLTFLLGINALRASEAAAVRIEDYGETLRGHRVLHLVGKGNKPATMPVTVPVLRVLEACRGERTHGFLILRPLTRKPIDRHDVYRMVQRIASKQASHGPSARTPYGTLRSPTPSTPASRFETRTSSPATPIHAPPSTTTAPAEPRPPRRPLPDCLRRRRLGRPASGCGATIPASSFHRAGLLPLSDPARSLTPRLRSQMPGLAGPAPVRARWSLATS